MRLILLAIALVVGYCVPTNVLGCIGLVVAMIMGLIMTFKQPDDLTPVGELAMGFGFFIAAGSFLIAGAQLLVKLFT